MITHRRRYYNETKNNTLPEHYIWKGLQGPNKNKPSEKAWRFWQKSPKLCQNRPKGQCCSLPKKRTREAVLRSRLCKGQTRAGRGSVLWKGLRTRSSKGQTGAGRGRVLGRVCEEGCWRVRCEQKIRGARWLEFEVALAVGVWGERAAGGAGIP